jgi:hypothetical protein
MDVQLIPINELELDYHNPRIARLLDIYKPEEINADTISLVLGVGDQQEGENYASFYSLKESIRTHGGLIHPILVNKQKDGRMVVIEGNTRLQIFRNFVKDNVAGNWDKIPCVVHKNLTPLAIDAIRLQSHLVGPRPWDPYSKAKYLNSLRNSKHMTFEQIVEFCGGRRRQVIEYIQAYNDMESFYRPAIPSGENFDPKRFSSFVELQRLPVQNALVEAGFTKHDFAKWVIDDLIGRQENVRVLPRILRNVMARKVFLQEGAVEAIKVLEVPSTDTKLDAASLSQLARVLQRRLALLPFEDLRRMQSDPQDSDREALTDVKASLDEVMVMIMGDEGV